MKTPSSKVYAVTNLIVTVTVIGWNYTANQLGIHGNTIASLSARYENLFTPAAYAFSIWGLIFAGLLAHAVFQVWRAFAGGDDKFIQQIGPWLIVANLANAMWVWAWLSEYTGLSVALLTTITAALLVVVVRLNMERWDAPRATIFWVWWPICWYAGWVSVATLANLSAYLVKIGWIGSQSEMAWALALVIAATLLNLWMLITRNMREFAAVGAWALGAIAARQWNAVPIVAFAAAGCAVLLVVSVGAHAYRNRATNPFRRRT